MKDKRLLTTEEQLTAYYDYINRALYYDNPDKIDFIGGLRAVAQAQLVKLLRR